MLFNGTTDFTIERDEEEIEINVDWSCEICNYGDGERDVDFETTATRYDNNEKIELTKDEEDDIYWDLLNNGEFN